MRRRLFRIRVAALIATTGLVTLAGPALAAGPHQVDVGTNTTGTHVFWAATSEPISYTIDGNSGPIATTCTSGMLGGGISAGPNVTGAAVATVDGSVWSDCTGLGLNYTFAQQGTWKLNATGPVTAASSDIVRVNLGSVALKVSAPFNSCEYTVSGKMNGTFDEATQQLRINESGFSGNLQVGSRVTGCLGLISPGAAFDLVTTYDIVSQDGPINFKP